PHPATGWRRCRFAACVAKRQATLHDLPTQAKGRCWGVPSIPSSLWSALARVSKDGRRRDRASGHPSGGRAKGADSRRMRSESVNLILRTAAYPCRLQGSASSWRAIAMTQAAGQRGLILAGACNLGAEILGCYPGTAILGCNEKPRRRTMSIARLLWALA